MNTTHFEALRTAVRDAFRGRVDVAWDGEPEPFASWGLVARLSITSDVERSGGGFECTRSLIAGRFTETTVQRRTAVVTIRLEALHPGTDPPAGALAARLHSRAISDALSAAGVIITKVNAIRYQGFAVDSRVLRAAALDVEVNYVETYVNEEILEYVEGVVVTGTVDLDGEERTVTATAP